MAPFGRQKPASGAILVAALFLSTCTNCSRLSPEKPGQPAEREASPLSSPAVPALSGVLMKTDFVARVSAHYVGSHGWGHIYRCQVQESVEGATPQSEFSVAVVATTDEYHGLLKYPTTVYPSLLIRFRPVPAIQYGPPPGFLDSSGQYWRIVSVSVPTTIAGSPPDVGAPN